MLSVTARGYDAGEQSVNGTWDPVGISGSNLWAKNDGLNETGLGMQVDSFQGGQREIDNHHFIQMDVSGIINTVIELHMNVGSIQNGPPLEGYYLYGSNTLGDPGMLLSAHSGSAFNGADINLFTIEGGTKFDYYSLSAIQGNVVFGALTAVVPETPTPEPSTLLFSGAGLLGLVAVVRRRRSA